MAEIIARTDNGLTIQVTIKLSGSLLEMENTAEFIAHWNSMHELSGVQRQNLLNK